MSWIKYSKRLHEKREVLQLAALLGVDTYSVAGRLLRLWDWLDDNISDADFDEDGNAHVTLGALQPETLDALIGTPGFASALASVGWMLKEEKKLIFPNLARHNGQTAKDRALATQRVAKRRAKSDPKCNGKSVTPVTVQPLTTPLPEERRVEKIVHLSSTLADCLAFAEKHSPPIPDALVRHWHSTRSAVGWEKGNGQRITNWQSDLETWWLRENRGDFPIAAKRQQNGHPQKTGNARIDRNIGTANEHSTKSDYSQVGKVHH